LSKDGGRDLTFSERIGSVATAVLLIGLLAFGLGTISWIIETLQANNMPWQIQLIAIGLVLMLFAVIGAKIFSQD